MRLFVGLFFLSSAAAQLFTNVTSRKNILFIIADDLRPELGVFLGSKDLVHPGIVSPNIDELASRSLLFKRAYPVMAVCGPSRTAMLTGRRVDTSHVHQNLLYFRDVGGNFTTLPQYFKDNGYMSVGMGKVFHPIRDNPEAANDPPSWSLPFFAPDLCCGRERSWRAMTPEDIAITPLSDILIADRAIETLHRFAPGGDLEEESFFLAVGFNKPHMPFTFPEEYLEYYPTETIGLTPYPYSPAYMPDIAWGERQDPFIYEDIRELEYNALINETMPEFKALELRRAYYACVTFIDDQVGRILEQVAGLGLDNNTIVVFLGDHGFKLGDLSGWAKHDNFDISLHAPIMIHIPGVTEGGMVSEEFIEHIDLFPTLVDLAGLPEVDLCPEHSANISICHEGSSLVSFFDNSTDGFTWKDRVFAQHPKDDMITANVMGYTMRNLRYRYTEYPDFDLISYTPNWNSLKGVELYDHDLDPGETYNRAFDSEYAEVRAELSEQLRLGWRSALPQTNASMEFWD